MSDEAVGGGERGAGQEPARRRGGPRGARFGWLRATLVLLLVGVAVAVAGLAWALHDAPFSDIASDGRSTVLVLEASDRSRIVPEGAYQAEYHELKAFPQHLIDAVLAIEDRRFYQHPGVDVRGILRAALRNFGAGGIVEGGSTITQQLVKIRHLEQDRTFKRKIQEAVLSLWLDRRLGKDEVLTRYLNSVYLGSGATGFPAAAKVYFNKDARDLTVAEAAMLAGLIRSPTALSPLNDLEAARARAAVVLDAMADAGRLSKGELQAAQLRVATLEPAPGGGQTPGNWYADWILAQVDFPRSAFTGNLHLKTTLDPRLQAQVQEILGRYLKANAQPGGPEQGAVVVMRPDGAVLAMVGGVDYGENAFNRAVSAKRQPGSTFKLFVYYAALKAGVGLDTMVEDAPIEIGDWKPENYGERYHGRVTVADAFAGSFNAASVRVAQFAGFDQVVAAARELGIDAELPAVPSIALGTTEVSLLDLTGAYASVRAGRAPVEPWGIAALEAEDTGRTFTMGPAKKPTTDISKYQPELVALLRQVVERGTGRAAATGGFAAGKTGTTQESRDAWFVGFTDEVVAGVWVGNDDNAPMDKVTGGSLPARIWHDVVLAASKSTVAPEPEEGVDEMVTGNLGSPRPGIEDGSANEVPIIVHDGTQSVGALCDIDACARAYRSFRIEDCTYQPYSGPRRLCQLASSARVVRVPREGGAAVQRVEELGPGAEGGIERVGEASDDAVVDPYGRPLVDLSGRPMAASRSTGGANACNYDACARSYRSFRPEDCTYKPFFGPRRVCTR